MKYYLMTDLEGPALVTRFDQTRDPAPADKAVAMDLLTGELNACIDGILDADPKAEMVAWDGHGSGGINITQFHPRARLIPRGPIAAPYYLDASYDALFFVGQHAMAGTPNAPLCHTYSSRTIEYYKLNGILIGEFGCRAALAGEMGVPTVFISGDDKAILEAQSLIPGIIGAITKEGLGLELAISLSHPASCQRIRKKAAEAVRSVSQIPPYRLESPYNLEIKVYEGKDISGYLKYPGARKINEQTVLITSSTLSGLPV